MALATKRWVDGRIEDVMESEHPRRLNRPGGGGGAAWSQINLGYSQSGNVITITAGALWMGVQNRIAIATADITISVNDTWIYVEHVFGSGTAALTSGTVDPVDDATTLRWPLSKWSYADSTAALAQLCHVGDIKVPLVRP